MEGLCGLNECKGKWVEEALIVTVVVCQLMGWKWDNGYVYRLLKVELNCSGGCRTLKNMY